MTNSPTQQVPAALPPPDPADTFRWVSLNTPSSTPIPRLVPTGLALSF
jgi:hypothetical protein